MLIASLVRNVKFVVEAFTFVIVQKRNLKISYGEYKKVGDIISDLNVMIQEDPIPNKQRCQLAEIVSDLKHIDSDEYWGVKDIDY